MTPKTVRAFALAGWLAGGFLGCGGSTPMDMWITKDPDAGRDFDAPMREVNSKGGSGGTGGDNGGGGTGGDNGGGGTGGDNGSGGTTGAGGTTGSAGDGAGTGGTGGGGGAGGTS